MHRNASNALRLATDAMGYQVGETAGRNSTPVLFRNQAKELKAPPEGCCWCDRCRMINSAGTAVTHEAKCATKQPTNRPGLGKAPVKCDCKPSGAFAPEEQMFMIRGEHDPRVMMVCSKCLGPDDEILRPGGAAGVEQDNREALAEAQRARDARASMPPAPKLPRFTRKQLAQEYLEARVALAKDGGKP